MINMTLDELQNRWDTEVGKHIHRGYSTESKPTEVLAFLQGESDTIKDDKLQLLFLRGGFPQFLIDEVEAGGETAALALRMLLLIEILSRDESDFFATAKDIHAKKLIGKTFPEVIADFKRIRYTYASTLIKGLPAYYPAETTLWVDKEFTAALATQSSGHKHGDKEKDLAFTVVCLAARLLGEDADKYGHYRLPLEEFVGAALEPGEGIVIETERFNALAKIVTENAWRGSPRLRSVLKEAMLRDLSNGGAQPGEAGKLCAELELPPWYPLYLLVRGEVMLRVEEAIYSDAWWVGRLAELKKAGEEQPAYLTAIAGKILCPHDAAGEVSAKQWEDGVPYRKLADGFDILAFMLAYGYDPPGSAALVAALAPLHEAIKADYPTLSDAERLSSYARLYRYLEPVSDFFKEAAATARSQNQRNRLATLKALFYEHDKSLLIPFDSEAQTALLIDRGCFTVKEILLTYVTTQKVDDPAALYLLRNHPQEAEEFTVWLFDKKTAAGNYPLLKWLGLAFVKGGMNPEGMFCLLSHSSKIIVRKVVKLILPREEELRPPLEKLRPKLKGYAGLSARRIFKQWDNDRRFGRDFAFGSPQEVEEYCAANYDDAARKHSSWLPEALLKDVRWSGSETKAPAAVLACLVAEYLLLEEVARLPICDKLVATLNGQDLEKTLHDLYQFWLTEGADAKKKMILAPYLIYASDGTILTFRQTVKDWTDASRGALAAFAVACICLNGSGIALMTVDAWREKAPTNQVKNAAIAAFEMAARELGVAPDVLADRIVPDFGFDQRGERELDFGTRVFRLSLNQELSLALSDPATEKALKSLPVPGAKDDKEKAVAAKKEFADLKKSLKALVQNQANRLEKVLMDGRQWTVADWTQLFVENPFLHRFAEGLIWAVYENGAVVETFRYLADGSFNNVKDEAYTLAADALISLAHPTELTEETLAAWRQQLDDYEITQPVVQLALQPRTLTAKEVDQGIITRYRGKKALSGKLMGALQKFNMRRGAILDSGSYTSLLLEDHFLGIGAAITFDTMYIGIGFDEEVTLGDAAFYRLAEDDEELVIGYDGIDPAITTAPADVPPRFISGVLTMFDSLIV